MVQCRHCTGCPDPKSRAFPSDTLNTEKVWKTDGSLSIMYQVSLKRSYPSTYLWIAHLVEAMVWFSASWRRPLGICHGLVRFFHPFTQQIYSDLTTCQTLQISYGLNTCAYVYIYPHMCASTLIKVSIHLYRWAYLSVCVSIADKLSATFECWGSRSGKENYSL